MTDQVKTDVREDDRVMMELGRKMGAIYADAIKSTVTENNWDSREKQCFLNGIMAELTGASCAVVGFGAAKDMFDHIAVRVVPQLKRKTEAAAERAREAPKIELAGTNPKVIEVDEPGPRILQ